MTPNHKIVEIISQIRAINPKFAEELEALPAETWETGSLQTLIDHHIPFWGLADDQRPQHEGLHMALACAYDGVYQRSMDAELFVLAAEWLMYRHLENPEHEISYKNYVRALDHVFRKWEANVNFMRTFLYAAAEICNQTEEEIQQEMGAIYLVEDMLEWAKHKMLSDDSHLDDHMTIKLKSGDKMSNGHHWYTSYKIQYQIGDIHRDYHFAFLQPVMDPKMLFHENAHDGADAWLFAPGCEPENRVKMRASAPSFPESVVPYSKPSKENSFAFFSQALPMINSILQCHAEAKNHDGYNPNQSNSNLKKCSQTYLADTNLISFIEAQLKIHATLSH